MHIRMLTIPALGVKHVTVKDFKPELQLTVHISLQKFLLEYSNQSNISIFRVFFWRDSLKVCEISTEPLHYSLFSLDRCSPFPVFNTFDLNFSSRPTDYICYHGLLYVLSSEASGYVLVVMTLRKEIRYRYSILYKYCGFKGAMEWEYRKFAAKQISSATYVTPWFVLIHSLTSKRTFLWYYTEENRMEEITLTRIRLCDYVAQRDLGETAVFLDAEKRLVMISEEEIRVVLVRYLDILPLLFACRYGSWRLPKVLVQEIALGYLVGTAE